MTITIAPTAAEHRTSLRMLCRLEAKSYLTRASIWIGLGLTIVMATNSGNDWSGASYQWTVPLSIGPFLLGVFIAGVRTGARDRSSELPGLAEEAPLDAGERAIARLAGLVVPVALGALVVIGITVVSRIEGGFWIGEASRRTDTAQHSVPELFQPVLLVALAGATGVAAGRAVRRAAPVMIVGAVVWFVFFGMAWAWNANGLHAFAPLQTQPMDVDLGTAVSLGAHLPTVGWHNAYLIGLSLTACGLAVRGAIGRRGAMIGLTLALIGVVAQLVVSPV